MTPPSARDDAAEARAAVTRARVVVLVMAAAMAVVSVTLALTTSEWDASLEPAGLWVPAVIAAGYFATERFVFRVEGRRQAFDFSLAEVPTAFALIFLPPWVAIMARVCGSVLARASRERVNYVKLAFNASLFALETALAAWLLRTFVEPSNPLALLGGAAACIAASSLLGGALVSLALGLAEGDVPGRLRLGFTSGLPVYALGALLGATALAPALLNPYLVLLPIVPTVIVWRLLTGRGALSQRYRDLSDLHEFTGVVNGSLNISEIVDLAHEQALRLLRAQGAALLAFDPSTGGIVHRATTTTDVDALPQSAKDVRWANVLAGRNPIRLNEATARGVVGLLPLLGWKDALAAPLRDSHDLVGLLVIADRVGSLAHFTDDDLARMRPLADQLAVSFRKGLLHDRMEYDATHDRLTGLPNRGRFERLLAAALDEGGEVGVLLLDLDRFKEVNDGLGHHMGDVLLQQFARRIVHAVGPGVTVSRLAGDEFALLCPGGDADTVKQAGITVVDAAREPFDLGELSVAVSCSVGMALAPAHGEDAATLLRRADMAMYQAKDRSSGLECYVPDMDSSSADRLRLLRDLRVALADDQMEAWFQPKVDLRTGDVVGAEALVRWHHPERGLLEAEAFIGLAEQTDVIHALTDHVLGAALSAASQWRARGWDLGVAVNVSARSLLDDLLADRVARQLSRHRVPPGMLTLEITETSMLGDAGRAIVTLDRLRDLGVVLSVDDFGTGYASLTYLHRLPVNELKIDRAFVRGMAGDSHDRVIVRSIVDLGRHLGLRVVAEGVEDAATAAALRSLGCDVGQGVWAAGPLPLPDLHRWLGGRGRSFGRAPVADTRAASA